MHIWWKETMVALLWKTVWESPRKLNRIDFESAIPLLDRFLKERNRHRSTVRRVDAGTISNSYVGSTSCLSGGENEACTAHTCTKISATGRNEVLTCTTTWLSPKVNTKEG